MIIDTVYESIIKKLTTDGKIENISQELRKKDNNNDRVLFVYKIFDYYNFFPNTLEVSKDDNASTHFRNLGNQCYTKKDLYKAWQYYNLSLMYAPSDSISFCLALSNRSAVFFELSKFKGCLRDIDLCFSYKYSEQIKDKLIKRKELCIEALCKIKKEEDDPEIQDILSFKGLKSEQYIGANLKLNVVSSKEMGRHVVAKQDIQVGEILVEEEPYTQIISGNQMLFACNHCLSTQINLIPCKDCCFALYCSEECRTNSWKEYHYVECPLMPTLIDMSFTKLELLALRIVIKARSEHDDWNSLYKIIEDAESNVDTEYHGHVKVGDKWIYDSKYYTSIHTLATNFDKRSVSDIFQKSVTAAVFLKFLLDKTDFLNADSDEEKNEICRCVAGLLLLHIMTVPTNMHGLTVTTDNGEGKYVSEINVSSGAYAFHSLFNHSCAPNVVRFTKRGTSKMKLVALRPIKKGMQIFDNYGFHHGLQDCTERQSALKFQYKFVCMCEACVNLWPTYFQLLMHQKRIPNKILRHKNKWLTTNIIDRLQNGDMDTVKKFYHKICALCEELDSFAPSTELCDCQEALKQCLFILQGLVLYSYNQKVDWTLKPF
ncbi:unnamed protein product [Pieris brassicae]|uniref:Protein-lysine N-methyltransferase SMYD4 n=1 Tax=Pieris brassicae TaxID=7116 RepID=A0A9P0X9Z0_PIEBR|nr:unnamed protein product [Pieris brassicae]